MSASVIPRAREMQNCGTSIVARVTGDTVIALNRTFVFVKRPEKLKDSVDSLKFERHRCAENVTAEGKWSVFDGSFMEARCIEGGATGDLIGAIGSRVHALSDLSCHVKRIVRR